MTIPNMFDAALAYAVRELNAEFDPEDYGDPRLPDEAYTAGCDQFWARALPGLLDRFPDLSAFGLWPMPHPRRFGDRYTPEQWADIQRRNRADLAEPEMGFARGLTWLIVAARGNGKLVWVNSYGAKHRAEEWWKRTGLDGSSYVSNGALIAAARVLQLEMKEIEEGNPNVLIRLPREALTL